VVGGVLWLAAVFPSSLPALRVPSLLLSGGAAGRLPCPCLSPFPPLAPLLLSVSSAPAALPALPRCARWPAVLALPASSPFPPLACSFSLRGLVAPALLRFVFAAVPVLACLPGPGSASACVFFPGGWPVVSPPSPPARPLVGFSGSRSLPASWSALVVSVVSAVSSAGRGVAVGCASGADLAVRSACPASSPALVFRASAFPGPAAARLARRSASLVAAVARSGSGRGFVGFVSSPCPASVFPSPSAAACFCGAGSGSWASLALAAGLGLSVVVFWCGGGAPSLPSAWGSWVPAGAGVWARGWRLVPAAARLPGLG
jgi:hypothetical protein